MAKRRSVTVDFEADTSGAIKGFRAVSTESGKTEKSFARFGIAAKTALVGVATGAVANFATDLNRRGLEIEQNMRRLETVFGDNADQVREWADRNNESFGISEIAAGDLATKLGDLLVPLGFARSDAADMATKAGEAAAAFSEWTGGAITVEDAATRIGAAIAGEREGLKQLGVVLKESDVNARLAEKGLEGLTGEAEKQEKAIATLELIYENGADALTAYAEGADSAYRDSQELSAQLADLKDKAAQMAMEIGSHVIPVLTDFFEMLGTPTQDDIDAIARKLGEVGQLNVDDVITSIGDMTPALEAAGFNVDEVAKKVLLGDAAWGDYIESVMGVFEETHLTAKEFVEAEKALDELRTEVQKGEKAQYKYKWELEDTARKTIDQAIAAADLEVATEGAAGATRDHTAAMAEQANPLLNAWSSLDRLREAQEKLNALAPGTAEYEDAVTDVVEAQLNLNGALAGLEDKEGAMAAITSAANQAGIKDAAAAVRELNEGLDRYNNWTPREKTINITVLQNGMRSDVIDDIIRWTDSGGLT